MLQAVVAFDQGTLAKMGAEIEPRVIEALRQNAEDVLQAAKALCPVRTGALRASLHIEQTGEFEYVIRDGVPYGIMVEKGHRDPETGQFVEPHPFLQPALDRMQSQCQKRIADATKTAVEEKAPSEREMQERSDAKLRELAGVKGGRMGILETARTEVTAARGG